MIDVVQALDLLEQCVSERGCGYVYAPKWSARDGYSTCQYVHNGKPDCIIGLAFAKSGVPVETLQTLSGDRLAGLHSEHRLPIHLTLGALVVFRAAQRAQDQGLSWGVALRQATLIAGRYFDLIPAAIVADAFDRYGAETGARDSREQWGDHRIRGR
ncbi:MAG: hypothetical protein QOH52_1328 [Pseudonocardiales bacterium]|nr:hypothetical protein [Pseudonocardiales bacterium]